MSDTVTAEYVQGIADARDLWRMMPPCDRITEALAVLANIEATMRTFSPGPVKDLLRGERDFWRNQVKRNGK